MSFSGLYYLHWKPGKFAFEKHAKVLLCSGGVQCRRQETRKIRIYGRHTFLLISFTSKPKKEMDGLDKARGFCFWQVLPSVFSSFTDGEPSVLHPYPELFAYNNYKEVNDQRGKSSILKRENTVTPHSHSNDTDIRGNHIREAPNKKKTSRSYLVDEEGNCYTMFLSFSNEVTVETTKNPTSIETMFKMPLHHEYINPFPYHPTFCDSETQTDLSMNNIFELEANLKLMKFDQENLVKTEERPCLTAEFVEKITPTDKNVSSYLVIPSVMALLGIFATCILDKASPSLKYRRGHEGTHHDAKYQLESSTKKKLVLQENCLGAFNFISNLWCGNVSDRYITEHSGFLDNIKAGDEVMADRGFLIRDLLLERKATLNISPFTKKCAQGKGRCLLTRNITKQKLKKLLNRDFMWNEQLDA